MGNNNDGNDGNGRQIFRLTFPVEFVFEADSYSEALAKAEAIVDAIRKSGPVPVGGPNRDGFNPFRDKPSRHPDSGKPPVLIAETRSGSWRRNRRNKRH